MSELTRDEIERLLRKADELIAQAQELQRQLHRAMGARAVQAPERRRETERPRKPRRAPTS